MKYKNFFEVGDKLEIKVIDGYIDINKNLISQLMEITSEDEYIVAMPIHKGKVINIPTSSKVSIIYSIKNKGIYCFDATVIYRNNENIAYIKIKQINETKKSKEEIIIDCLLAIKYLFTTKKIFLLMDIQKI